MTSNHVQHRRAAVAVESMNEHYGDNSKSQQANFLLLRDKVMSLISRLEKEKNEEPLVAGAARKSKILIKSSSSANKLVLVDYGCADGASSVFLIQKIREVLLSSTTSFKEVEYVLQDLPGSNWRRLQETIQQYGPFCMMSSREGRESDERHFKSNILNYADENMKLDFKGLSGSFYDQLMEDESVDIAFSCYAMHWMNPASAAKAPFANSVINCTNRCIFGADSQMIIKAASGSESESNSYPKPLFQLLYRYGDDEHNRRVGFAHDEPNFLENPFVTVAAKEWDKLGFGDFLQVLGARESELKPGAYGAFLIPAIYYDSNVQIKNKNGETTGYSHTYRAMYGILDEILDRLISSGQITSTQRENICLPVHKNSVGRVLSVFRETEFHDRRYKRLKLVELELFQTRNPYLVPIVKDEGGERHQLDVKAYTDSIKAWSQGMFSKVFGQDTGDMIYQSLSKELEEADVDELMYDFVSYILVVQKV